MSGGSEQKCEREDWALLADSARGDDAAFGALVARYQSALLNFFYRCGAKQDAEDLVQETFLKLYRYRKRAKPIARFTTYLHTLGHRVWLDHVRGRSRRIRLLERAAPEMPAADDRSSGRPSAILDANVLLDSLSAEHREAVVLIVYQGLAYQEAAEILGVPEGTVKSRVFHALQRMRAMMNGGGENSR